MAEPDKKTRHDGRTSRLQPCADRRTGEALDWGLITREELRATYQELLN
jgi:hypothetical protein